MPGTPPVLGCAPALFTAMVLPFVNEAFAWGTDKRVLSEPDICAKFITPALRGAGWDEIRPIREGREANLGS